MLLRRLYLSYRIKTVTEDIAHLDHQMTYTDPQRKIAWETHLAELKAERDSLSAHAKEMPA